MELTQTKTIMWKPSKRKVMSVQEIRRQHERESQALNNIVYGVIAAAVSGFIWALFNVFNN